MSTDEPLHQASERENTRRKGLSTSPTNSGRRVQRFLNRIDEHLAVLENDALRCDFLNQQVKGWEARYSRFLSTDGTHEPICDPADPIQAADFLLTIAALAKRRNTLRRGGYSMPQLTQQSDTIAVCKFENWTSDQDAREKRALAKRHADLHRAMLSLLVAADQRCPAIIGQAHLLYHADAESWRLDSAQAVAQLKSDAEDLLKAIVAAEAALCTAHYPGAHCEAMR